MSSSSAGGHAFAPVVLLPERGQLDQLARTIRGLGQRRTDLPEATQCRLLAAVLQRGAEHFGAPGSAYISNSKVFTSVDQRWHELAILRRQTSRPKLTRADRALLASLSRSLGRPAWAVFPIKPETLLR
jgi:hypothetical protein